MTQPQKVFFPNLDALRFLCFLAVFLSHCFHTEYSYLQEESLYKFVDGFLFQHGNLGVNFFFVLSGFLITFLLLKEQNKAGKINAKHFYVRRILRIWPLYYCCVFFGFVIFPILKTTFGGIPNETANPITYLFFVNNFDFIQKGVPDASILGVLWSIAVEEQFYLVWPILFLLLPKKYYPLIFACIIFIAVIFRIYFDNYMYHEYHTLSCMGDIAIGSWGAWLTVKESKFKDRIENSAKFNWVILYGLVLVLFLFRHELYAIDWLRPFERPIIAFLFLLVILEQNFAKHSLFKMKRFVWMSKLGKITYGLYCLQFIGILITTTLTRKLGWNTNLWQVLFLETLLALALTIIIAQISYICLEKPFLKLKKKFSA